MAVARVIDPAVVPVVRANVAIELAGTHTRGATVVDLHGVTGRQPNARVAITIEPVLIGICAALLIAGLRLAR